MSAPSVRIGCAVGEDAVTAVLIGVRGAAESTVVTVADGDEPLSDRLATALAGAVSQLLVTSDRQHARLRVALLPPLAQVRRISLPPMREQERTQVLTRDAARYFLGVGEPQVVTSAPAADRGVIASAAPEGLLSAFRDAVPENVVVDAFIPAASAWAASTRAADQTCIELGSRAVLVSARRGRITDYRQCALHRAQSVDSATLLSPSAAAEAAASQAWIARDLVLLTLEDRHRLRRQRIGRLRVGAAAALILLLLGVVGAHLNVRRQLADVRSQRAMLLPELAPALADMDSLMAIEERLAEARTMTASTSWSDVLPLIAQRLPTDAHLIQVIGIRDSLQLRIQARAAADVLPELRAAPLFQQVRIAGAIERDVTNPQMPTERFDIAAVVHPSDAQR